MLVRGEKICHGLPYRTYLSEMISMYIQYKCAYVRTNICTYIYTEQHCNASQRDAASITDFYLSNEMKISVFPMKFQRRISRKASLLPRHGDTVFSIYLFCTRAWQSGIFIVPQASFWFICELNWRKQKKIQHSETVFIWNRESFSLFYGFDLLPRNTSMLAIKNYFRARRQMRL